AFGNSCRRIVIYLGHEIDPDGTSSSGALSADPASKVNSSVVTTDPYAAYQIFGHGHIPSIRGILGSPGFSSNLISFVPQRPRHTLTGPAFFLGPSTEHI